MNKVKIISLFLILIIITTTVSLAFDEDSIYVWSNFTTEDTLIVPSSQEQIDFENSTTR